MTQHKWFYQAYGMAMYSPDAHNDNNNALLRPKRQSYTLEIGFFLTFRYRLPWLRPDIRTGNYSLRSQTTDRDHRNGLLSSRATGRERTAYVNKRRQNQYCFAA